MQLSQKWNNKSRWKWSATLRHVPSNDCPSTMGLGNQIMPGYCEFCVIRYVLKWNSVPYKHNLKWSLFICKFYGKIKQHMVQVLNVDFTWLLVKSAYLVVYWIGLKVFFQKIFRLSRAGFYSIIYLMKSQYNKIKLRIRIPSISFENTT